MRPTATLPADDQRYRLLIEAITDYAIYMLDPDGFISSWNPGAQRFKGYEASEVMGKHFSLFYPKEEQAADAPGRALRIARDAGRFESEGWRIRKDGTRFWAHVIIDAIMTRSGELIGYAKITRDLTERKEAEESLRQSEEHFRILVQGVTDYAIYLLDPDGRVTNWNPGAQRIKGYAPEEIIGSHFSRFYTEADREAGEPLRALSIAVKEGRFEKEGIRVRKDGSEFWAHVIIDPIRNPAGKIVGFAKITRDITERRENQAALDRAREALFQSQKLEAIGQLTGGVAHDFNNLLMAILGSLDLVRKRLPHDPRVTPLLDNAVLAAERGAGLTQRMLAFARKQELKMQSVELPALIRGMTDLLQGSLGPSIILELRLPRGLPLAHSDPGQLEAVVLNLAVNARDAMPAGGAITIEATPEKLEEGGPVALPAGRYVRLSVRDTGEGMDPDTLARATEPFYTTKEVGKGTGLGLSMAHGLAEQSGGLLRISSRVGEGTVVDIWLPESQEIEERQIVTGTARVDLMPRIAALTVLAVDDDELVRSNMVAMLEDLGHRVFPATSASEALTILRRQKFDLVITDYAMPKMTGLQLADAARAQYPDLPIVLATGYAELPPGAAIDLPRLAKPFFQHDLARLIEEVMALPQAPATV
jgi:PAS domain S-box-containing protein